MEAKLKPDEERKQVKFALTKRLYEKGFSKNEINNLYKFIDWLIGLPGKLEIEYLERVYKLEGEKKMPYITSAERFGIEKGEQQKAVRVAIDMIKEGFDEKIIIKLTGLSQEKINSLQEKQ